MSQLEVVYFQNRIGRWTWRLKQPANRTHWAMPSQPKGYFSLSNAKRSFNDMVSALGADPANVRVTVKPYRSPFKRSRTKS